MFVLKEDRRFEWTVKVEVPQAGGKFLTQLFTGVFVPIDADRQDEIMRAPISQQDAMIAAEALQGWGEDVTGEDARPLPFDEENKARLLKIPYVRTGVVRAYFDAMSGKAERKN